MKKSEVYEVFYKSDTELSICVKGIPAAKFLFFACLIALVLAIYGAVLFYTKYSSQFKIPVIISSFLLIGIGLFILFR
ncbi:MAG: hypothetical protein N3A69_12060, partial [Leptospiraceae bacterium]|nr:hypothetical protein [Leptospiraceae bacterium]